MSGSYNVFIVMWEVLGWVGLDDLVYVFEEDILIGVGYFDFYCSVYWLVFGVYLVSVCENIFLFDDVWVLDCLDVVYLLGVF